MANFAFQISNQNVKFQNYESRSIHHVLFMIRNPGSPL